MGSFWVIVLLGLGGYLASLMLHPYARCGTCRGTGVHRGAVFSYATRPCHRCTRGRRQRVGAAVLGIGKRNSSGTVLTRPAPRRGRRGDQQQ